MAVFSRDGKEAFVANAGDANISVVDVKAQREINTFPAGKGVMAFEPTRNWELAWLTGPDEDKVFILNLATWERVAALEISGEPHGLVLSPDGKSAYLVRRKLNQLARIDTASRKIVKTASMGKRPDMLAISPDGRTLYLTSRDENKLLVVSAADLKVKAEVATGEEPHGVA